MSISQTQSTILIVDDCELNLRLLQKILQSKGYNSVTASSGIEALKLIEKNSFYAIFLDIRMPGIDGFEVVRQIRKNFPERIAKLVAITASTLSFHDPQFREVGFHYSVGKPYSIRDIDELLSKIKSAP